MRFTFTIVMKSDKDKNKDINVTPELKKLMEYGIRAVLAKHFKKWYIPVEVRLEKVEEEE